MAEKHKKKKKKSDASSLQRSVSWLMLSTEIHKYGMLRQVVHIVTARLNRGYQIET
jgi:hypothetical protein